MSSLKKQAIKGTIWSIVGYGGSQVVRLGSNLVLTRLLVPELFGLLALVHTFVVGLAMFSDIGLRGSIIRSQRYQDPVFLNTAWTLQAIRGFGIWLVTIAIAWPITAIYNDSRLLWLVPVVGFTSVISGFNSTSLITLERQLDIRKIAALQLSSQVINTGVMIVWACISPTILALVVGNFTSNIIQLLWSHKLNTEEKNGFEWDKKAVQEIISFGKWIFISTIMTFLARQADRLLLAKLLSFEFLGVYFIAFTLADVPQQIIRRISSQIMYPLVSRYATENRSNLREIILQKRKVLLGSLACLVALVVCFGDFAITILYDRRYHQAAWMLPILAVGLWPLILSLTIDKVLFVLGVPKYIAFGNFLKFIYMIIFIPLGIHYLGVLGAVLAISSNGIPFYMTVLYGLSKHNMSGIKQDIIATLFLLLLIILVSWVRYVSGFGLSIDGALETVF